MRGTPGRSRTYNLILRTDLLYPVELPRHVVYFNRLPLSLARSQSQTVDTLRLAGELLAQHTVIKQFSFSEPVWNFFLGIG